MKRICSWCKGVIDEGQPSDVTATWGMCSACKSVLNGEMAEVERLQEVYGRFPCAVCPRDGSPYRMTRHGNRQSLFVRCAGCGLRWIVEA